MEIDNPKLWLKGYQGYYGTWYASNGGILLDDGLSMAENYWTYVVKQYTAAGERVGMRLGGGCYLEISKGSKE